MTIFDQRITVALANKALEQAEISAEAEHIRSAATQDQIAKRHLLRAKSLLDQVLPAFKVIEHRRREARATGRVHEGPESRSGVVIQDIKFLKSEKFVGNGGV